LKFAVAYVLSPIDIIPDFIPVIGHIDDVIIVPTLMVMAIRMIPKQVIADCREKCKSNDYFKCEECGLLYKEKIWAEKCQEWCFKNKSCNLEIIKHSVKDEKN